MLSERQKQIIVESILLIDSKGVHGFTIKNLSKEIGISEPGIYRHFESKSDILYTILETFRQEIEIYQHSTVQKSSNPMDLFHEYFDQIFENFINNPALTSVVLSEEIFRDEERLMTKVSEIQGLNEQLLLGLLMKMKRKKVIAPEFDSEMFVIVFFGSVRFLVRQWKNTGYSFDLRSKGVDLFQTLSGFLRAPHV
ncbi:TetR/AcrR family transcriptional regulator [Gaoshiqia sediminis]|uniref:TetR/AcrR family transcriptional regulator n=1 Tax=Gaoshiqia sediminis TaxID=2986998 RepID=A0AA41Y713_9BACT|nr:TetR/AcrR family transcriptional regulator [Gaoshiqia sediminis]MCW0482287.1 TetR/AcrR family transcriptional regulator [Gaoshiqia sediminis]